MKNKILYICIALLGTMLAGCDKEPHEVPTDTPVGEAVVTVTMNTDHTPDAPLNDVHLYWFDETDRLTRHLYYPSMEELALSRITLPEGSYTVMAVLNVGADFEIPPVRSTLPDIDLNMFSAYVKAQEGNYADMLTGTLRHVVKNGVQLVYIDLEPKSGGIKETAVSLLVTLPSTQMPELPITRSATPAALRGVAYIYEKGSTRLYAVRKGMLTATDAQGVYRMGLSLFKGAYDVRLWVDYATDAAADLYYNTAHIQSIVCLDPYRGSTHYRDCMYGSASFELTDNTTAVEVAATAERPLARYRILATDTEKFVRRMKSQGGIEGLTITFTYGFYLPIGFDMTMGVPVNSVAGVTFTTPLTLPQDGVSECEMGFDYVFVNGTESFVVLTIEVRNAQGKVVSRTNGLKVPYKRGHQTTVKGDLLTNEMEGGVDIDPDFDGDIDVDIDDLFE